MEECRGRCALGGRRTGGQFNPHRRGRPPGPFFESLGRDGYGPFLSVTLEAPQPAGNLSYKGIVVPLKPDRSAAMVLDTDLLRWSAGWRGPFIDWKNIPPRSEPSS